MKHYHITRHTCRTDSGAPFFLGTAPEAALDVSLQLLAALQLQLQALYLEKKEESRLASITHRGASLPELRWWALFRKEATWRLLKQALVEAIFPSHTIYGSRER